MKEKMTVNDTVREALAVALLKLMKTKPLEDITISELVNVAGVGRNSFYRNFESKEQMLCGYITQLYEEYFREKKVPLVMDDAGRIEEFLLPRFRFIKEHKDIFRVLHKRGLLYYFFQETETDLIAMLCGQTGNTSSYFTAMFSGACAGIIRHWIDRDFAGGEEEMVKLFANPPRRI